MMHRPNGRIRPPKKPLAPKGQVDEFQACWKHIEDALTDIHNQDAGRLSFEQLYRASYKIVIVRKADELHDCVAVFEAKWFQDKVIPPILELLSDNLLNLAVGDFPNTSANERRDTGERFLKGLRGSWEKHARAMNMVADILMYLDRSYETGSRRPPIFHTTIGLFRDNILRSRIETGVYQGELAEVLNVVILDLINMERGGHDIDRTLIRKCLMMLEGLYETNDPNEDVTLYDTVFTPAFMSSSRQFYAKEAEELVREANTSTWLRHTQRRLDEEKERCQTTVAPSSENSIIQIVQQELISKFLEEFLALETTGLKSMVDNDRFDDLRILFGLVYRIDHELGAFKAILQKHIVNLGIEIEKSLADTDFTATASTAEGAADGGADGGEKSKAAAPSQQALHTAAAIKWVEDVLSLKDRFDYLTRECFGSNVTMESTITRSFTDFINLFGRSSEYVSLYIDDNLKRGIRGKTEAEVDESLAKAITLIRYLSDKDMFERYYQKHLARRLLHSKSESTEAEKQMISRMKQEIGNHFTSKFEGMYKDMDTSRELTSGYRTFVRDLGDSDDNKTELGIHVLTSNHWPQEAMGRGVHKSEASRMDCIYPASIQSLQKSFLNYYLQSRNGRILTWLGSAGSADIKCVFPKVAGKESGPLSKERRYELNVSTHGMIVLLLFNSLPDGATSLTYEEIQHATSLPKGDLNRVLASLSVAPKSRVLAKDPLNKVIRPGDKFSFNESFQSKMIRIKAPIVSAVSKVEDDDERKGTESKNNEARAHIMDAAIVRIMKSRKEMTHNNLITEVVTQVAARFKPEVTMIKKRIEDLIAREYLERGDDPSKPTYTYLA